MLETKLGRVAQRDYGYINARVRAMSTELLRQETYKKLLETEDVKGVSAFLQNTDYGLDLKESQDKYAGLLEQIVVFEKALESNFQRKMDKVKSMLDGEARILFDLLLEKWDVQNIKTILRYKHVHADSPSIIRDLTFIGNLSRELLETLAQAEDIEAVIAQLESWNIDYARPLRDIYNKVVGERRYILIELALDQAYYDKILASSHKRKTNYRMVYDILVQEIDMLNVLTGLRLVKAGVAAEDGKEYFITGGLKFKIAQFNNLIKSSSLEEAFEYLKKISYQKIIEGRWSLYKKIKDISVFERSFGEEIVKELYRQHRQGSLGFGIVQAYLRLKFNELVNLRIIGRSKEFGVPEDIIRGEIILFN